MEIVWYIWWHQLWCHFRDKRSNPSVPRYKTKKKGHTLLNQILFCQVPSFSILVGPLFLLNAVRHGRFGGGWLLNPSWTFTAALNWAWISYMVPQCILIPLNRNNGLLLIHALRKDEFTQSPAVGQRLSTSDNRDVVSRVLQNFHI